jgi:hypothetical protein
MAVLVAAVLGKALQDQQQTQAVEAGLVLTVVAAVVAVAVLQALPFKLAAKVVMAWSSSQRTKIVARIIETK